MQYRLSLNVTMLIFIILSLTLVLGLCSSGYIMADSRNDHNSQDKRSHDNNHSKGDSRNDHNNQGSENNSGDKADVTSVGNQNINCMGSFMNCRNDITTFVCAHVTYCFIGPTSPFMMANPTSQ
ncbi:MAG TPA: hypothetical protein VH796_03510 [Nitrososphaeraceae archaeon]